MEGAGSPGLFDLFARQRMKERGGDLCIATPLFVLRSSTPSRSVVRADRLGHRALLADGPSAQISPVMYSWASRAAMQPSPAAVTAWR